MHAAIGRVLEVYGKAAGVLGSVQIIDHENSMTVEGSPGVHAWSTHNGAIRLNETFWKTDGATRMLTILHEATHFMVSFLHFLAQSRR